jgi:hypothetical protein
MAIWDSNTKWRQGHMLSAQAALGLSLTNRVDASQTLAMVVSHDCDLAQPTDREPVAEIIVGRKIPTADGNYAFAKNVRTLHLDCTQGSTSGIIEIVATDKVSVPKDALQNYEPDPSILLSYEELVILQRWLAVRYHRSAFPDEFNNRLRETGVEKVLKDVSKKFGVHLRAIFFDVDEGREIERSGTADTYDLNIVLLYDTDNDAEIAEANAAEASALIIKAFREKCCNNLIWENIELQSCEFMSDQAITYRQALSFKEWRSENVSLKSKPPQPSLVR